MNEAELVLTELLQCDRLSLHLHKHRRLGTQKAHILADIFKRRLSGQPLQYILGKTEFMGLEFKVTKDVLVPRPETEILVEAVVNLVKTLEGPRAHVRIMDVGTGSGCIAVSLAKFLPGVYIVATDVSASALALAGENAGFHDAPIDFRQADVCAACAPADEGFDLIVSNPPYVPSKDIAQLASEVRAQPRISLDGGEDGLDYYRRLIAESPACLKARGFLAMEMGFGQAEPIKKIFLKSGKFEIIDIIKDYSGIDRVIITRKNKNYG
jgi:release factor glutamine methyltransferase